MIHEIRRAEALRSLPQWICASALIILLLSPWVAFVTVKDPEPLSKALPVILWCAVAPFFAGSQVRRRCRPFDLALPIPARRLWLAQVLAVLLAALVILALPAVFVVRIFSPTPGELFRVALHLGTGLAFAVAVLQGAGPLATLPLSRGRVLLTVVSLAGVLAILMSLSALPLLWSLVPLGLAVALAARTWCRLPAAFTLVPLAAEAGGTADREAGRLGAEEWAATAAGGRVGWRWKVLHHVSQGRLAWLGWPLIFAVGLMVAILVLMWEKPEALVFATTLLLLSMFLFSIPKMARLPFLDPLPIGRRALFATLVLSNAGVFALGYGAGRTAFAVLGGARDTGPALPVVLLVAGLPWLLFLAVFFSTVRPAIPTWVREVVAVAILFVASPFLLLAIYPLHFLIRQLGESPAVTLAAWLVTTLLLLGGYLVAQASFESIELPARPERESGLGGGSP